MLPEITPRKIPTTSRTGPHGRLYWELIRSHIGEADWTWLKGVEADHKPYRFYLSDWLKHEAWLKTKLRALEDEHPAIVELIE
jgi:hypothetical protein